jgi:hypothetical protein
VGWQSMYDEPPRKLIEQGWKDDTDAPSYNEITHNYIHDSCTVIPGCTGLFVAFSPNTRIAHNEICNLPYTGISIGAIWTDKETVQKNCTIEYNYVHHYNRTMHDSGGLYTLGRQDGTLFRNNVVHDSKNAHGIYTDEGSSFITFENNIVYNSGKFNYHHHHGHDNMLRNNILASPGRACVVRLRNDEPKSFSMFYNIFWMDGGTPFELRTMHNKPDNGKYVFDYNIYWSTKAFFILFHNYYPLALWREEFKQDEHSIIVDPEFRDPKNGDFTLSPDSPAIAAGFKPIDTSRVGPQKPYDEVLNGYERKR